WPAARAPGSRRGRRRRVRAGGRRPWSWSGADRTRLPGRAPATSRRHEVRTDALARPEVEDALDRLPVRRQHLVGVLLERGDGELVDERAHGGRHVADGQQALTCLLVGLRLIYRQRPGGGEEGEQLG